MVERIAHLLVRLYPCAWRERYADEMTALLNTAPVGFLQVLDLGRGCVGEWRRAALDRLGRTIPDVGRAMAISIRFLTSMLGSMLVGLPGVALATVLALLLRTSIGDGQGSVVIYQYLAWLGLISIGSYVFPRFALGSLSADDRRLVRRTVVLCLVCIVLRQWGIRTRSYGDIDTILITLSDAMVLGMLVQIERGWFRPIRPPRRPDEIIQLRLSAP